MTRLKMFACSLPMLVVAGLIAYPVFAHSGKSLPDGRKIVTQFDQNKMTLAKAVTAAELYSKGRAITVISELNDSDKLALEVYCITGDKILRVDVDGTAASVIDMKEVKEFPITEEVQVPGPVNPRDPAAPRTPATPGTPGTPATPATPATPGTPGSGNSPASAKMITNQTLEVGCGTCTYHMAGVESCALAVKIDGKSYLVEGANVDAHKAGLCSKTGTQALVSGHIEGDKFIATKFELKS